MTSEDIREKVDREPLVDSGRAACELIVFKGVKREGSHQATGFEEIAYDKIERIEPRRARGGRRRKAS